MSDDQWRRRPEDDDDFGGPLFGDEPGSGAVRRIPAKKKPVPRDVEPISFGDSDAGPLQHWSEPPTGELPGVLAASANPDPTDDLDVWSSFSGSTSKWSDDTGGDLVPAFVDDADDITGLHPIFEDAAVAFDDSTPVGRDVPAPREQGRITIGTDPTDGLSTRSSSASSPPARRTRPEGAARAAQSRQRPRPPSAGRRPAKPAGGTAGRDMPTVIAVGLV